ncbi:hypothetical protein PV779_48140, partial [Streptomyces sp. ID01-9D]|nr:hypothetical protein [Streptomyces sp. ID01-9D]
MPDEAQSAAAPQPDKPVAAPATPQKAAPSLYTHLPPRTTPKLETPGAPLPKKQKNKEQEKQK